MALRELTTEERDAARKKALDARVERAQLKKDFNKGNIDFPEVLKRAGDSEAVARLKTIELLEALPGVGRVTAMRILDEQGVSVNRRIGGLGAKQRAGLTKYLEKHLAQLG